MRNFSIAAAASVLSIAASFAANASLTAPDQPQSEPTRIEELDYFPMCGLSFEPLIKINPDRLVLIKICT